MDVPRPDLVHQRHLGRWIHLWGMGHNVQHVRRGVRAADPEHADQHREPHGPAIAGVPGGSDGGRDYPDAPRTAHANPRGLLPSPHGRLFLGRLVGLERVDAHNCLGHYS